MRKNPTDRRKASVYKLAADYKARGMERTRAWSEFVKDRSLQPEIDAKEFYKYYDVVDPKPLKEGSEPEGERKPKQAYIDPETIDFGRRVRVTISPGKKYEEIREGTIYRTLQGSNGPVYEVDFGDGPQRIRNEDKIEFLNYSPPVQYTITYPDGTTVETSNEETVREIIDADEYLGEFVESGEEVVENPEFTEKQTQIARTIITNAESVFRRKLSIGEMTDLLLDRLNWLKDSANAKSLLRQIGKINPLRSPAQYRLARAAVEGRTDRMSPEMAREMLEKTGHKGRSRLASNPSDAFKAGEKYYYSELKKPKAGSIRLDVGAMKYLKKLGLDGAYNLGYYPGKPQSAIDRTEHAKQIYKEFIDGGSFAHDERIRKYKESD